MPFLDWVNKPQATRSAHGDVDGPHLELLTLVSSDRNFADAKKFWWVE